MVIMVLVMVMVVMMVLVMVLVMTKERKYSAVLHLLAVMS